ncbi:MAG TPA: biotin--[acetyl-CoA-carboxylase] ligase [Gemmatimonadaceae bacterium]
MPEERYAYDGYEARDLAQELDLPRIELLESVPSTMDIAHEIAGASAPAGTLVLADEQTAGRGRSGSPWVSHRGAGIWMTMIERPAIGTGVPVLSLRLGIRCARALDLFADEPIRLKWPNDLYVGPDKLGGILVEARWRQDRLDWVAVGVGINVTTPSGVKGAAGLDAGTRRIDVLRELIPCVRGAAASAGDLTLRELSEFDSRDLALGRKCIEPARGTVSGISASGELLVALADSIAKFRSGSLILEQPS